MKKTHYGAVIKNGRSQSTEEGGKVNIAATSLGYTSVVCYHGEANEEIVDLVQRKSKLLV